MIYSAQKKNDDAVDRSAVQQFPRIKLQLKNSTQLRTTISAIIIITVLLLFSVYCTGQYLVSNSLYSLAVVSAEI